MAQATVYSTKGTKVREIELPDTVFGLKWNADLVSQVAHSMNLNKRLTVAHVKDRGDVRGGGKKPWRQKGTGRARHGSSRSPIWVGGGVTHGPSNEKNFSRKVNKKMKDKALFTVLSQKLNDGEIVLVDAFSFAEPKTKVAKEAIVKLSKADASFEKLATKKKNTAVISMDKKDMNTEKSFSNMSNMTVLETRNLNILDLLNAKYLVIENPENALAFFTGKKIFKKSEGTLKEAKTAKPKVAKKAKTPAKKVVSK